MIEKVLTTENRLGSDSAYPAGIATGLDGGLYVSNEVAGAGGLTKRELFAAMAMQGLCANSGIGPDLKYAEMSVRFADDLLKELAK